MLPTAADAWLVGHHLHPPKKMKLLLSTTGHRMVVEAFLDERCSGVRDSVVKEMLKGMDVDVLDFEERKSLLQPSSETLPREIAIVSLFGGTSISIGV